MEKIKTLYPSVLLVAGLIAMSVITAYLVVNKGFMAAPIIVLALGALLVLGWMMRDYKMGVYVVFALALFAPLVNRLLGTMIPFGVPIDILSALTFFIMLFSTREKLDWAGLKSWITYTYIIILVYQLLQAFNPNAVSIAGWLVSLRGYTLFLLFLVFFQMFLAFENAQKFTAVWLGLATLVALYGLYQEVFGLPEYEMRWLKSSEEKFKLYYQWGHLRVFSLLSDPSAFGLFMGFSGLACFILMLGPFPGIYKLLLGGLGSLMFISMSFSGTRTAYAMVVIGVVFYGLVTLRNRKSLLAIGAAGIIFMGIIYGPFYGGPFGRIRSTFRGSDDASMNVRNVKRIRMQEYVQTNPVGGGFNTTGQHGLRYSPGHPLSRGGAPPLSPGWDPDSGYLFIALETGWIGLLFSLMLFFFVIAKGINNYFSIDDPLLKTYTLAYFVPFMALSVAHYTQDALFQKPVYLVTVATYAFMLTLPTYETRNTKPLSNTK